MANRPIVVGGSAEIYWARTAYYATDLDMCAPIGDADKRALEQLGFQSDGRFWYRHDLHIYVEFPEPDLAGDPQRVKVEVLEGSPVQIIGVDDLYLDRLRQTTAERVGGERFRSAIAIAAARYDEMDFRYVNRQIQDEVKANPQLADMVRTHRSIMRRVRRSIAEAEGVT